MADATVYRKLSHKLEIRGVQSLNEISFEPKDDGHDLL